MDALEFTVPPLLHYLVSGYTVFGPGDEHVGRRNTGIFDLIYVLDGCLYMGEEDRLYEVRPGEALILRPDCLHFATRGCKERTPYYWLHFQTTGGWRPAADELTVAVTGQTGSGGFGQEDDEQGDAGQGVERGEQGQIEGHIAGRGEQGWGDAGKVNGLLRRGKPYSGEQGNTETIDINSPAVQFNLRTFPLRLPQYIQVAQPAKLREVLEQLVQLAPTAHLSAARFKQQILFQEVVQLIMASGESSRPSPSTACAEQAAAYLRAHYQEAISAQELGERLSFHPVYIARCMQREYGCSPVSYLLRFRIEQSKLLLMRTDNSIARIAEEVGFRQAAYFSSCFQREEGISPREFRRRFSRA